MELLSQLMSNKTGIRSISSSIGNRTSSGIDSTIDSLGSKMISPGSSNSRLINRNNSSIGVGNKLSVQVERTSITGISNNRSSCNSRGSSNNRCSGDSRGSGNDRSSSNSRGSSNSRSRSNNRCRCSIFSSLSFKMCSTSSSYCWFIKRNNSTIGMSNELVVEVKRTSIAISSSIRISSITIISSGIGISSISRISSSVSQSCISISGSVSCISQTSKLSCQMICPGSSYSWLINRGDCSIGMSLKAEKSLGGGHSNTGSKNQKLHICRRGALELK